jgi:multidrug efflux system outer membrane protein
MSKYADDVAVQELSGEHRAISARIAKAAQIAMITLLTLIAIGCNVGPNYRRPAESTPESFRGALAPEVTPAAHTEPALGDEQWSAVFQDPILRRLVTEALKNNLDLRVAAQRVLEAQAQVGITRSQQFPSVSAGGSYSALQVPSSLAGNKSDGTPANSFINGGGFSASAAWSLDFWELYRRQTEAARAELLASEWAWRTHSQQLSPLSSAGAGDAA